MFEEEREMTCSTFLMAKLCFGYAVEMDQLFLTWCPPDIMDYNFPSAAASIVSAQGMMGLVVQPHLEATRVGKAKLGQYVLLVLEVIHYVTIIAV